MMPRWIAVSAFVGCLLCTVGCKHVRYSAFATVDGEMRKISTRNRYTLVGVKVSGQANADLIQANLKSQQFTNDTLRRYQPEVFSDDGIMFMIRSTSFPRTTGYGWTECTYMLSLTVLPMCRTAIGGEHIVIDVLDNPDARDAFDLYGRGDQALSLFCPLTPPLVFMGDAPLPEKIKAGGSMSRHFINFIVDYSVEGDECGNATYKEFRAYAIASILKKMEDGGLIDEFRSGDSRRSSAQISAIDDRFEVVDFKRDNEHRYTFALKGRGGGAISLKGAHALKKSLRAMMRDDYIASFPDASVDSLIVDFPEFSLRDGMVTGKADVLSIAVESLRYDSSTRKGTMRVRIGENQFEASRRYARKNIETIVRDKNIALDTRDIPPAAVFYLLEEKIDGHILELTFRTE